jgi:2-hydroxy-6-oxonona-2,4-dienedioate hydrolase
MLALTICRSADLDWPSVFVVCARAEMKDKEPAQTTRRKQNVRIQRNRLLSGVLLLMLATAVAIWWQFNSDITAARARAANGAVMVATRCGPIEYEEAGQGVPLLIVHGSGGGHDQGMAFGQTFAKQGVRVIAVSRFGYLGTPMPADASPEAQADAHACLLDALGVRQAAVLGASAGAPSATQFAIRHADRITALILVVPLIFKPFTPEDSAASQSAFAEKVLLKIIGSDFVYWTMLQVARDQIIQRVLATPPTLVTNASAAEQARVNAMLENILPLSSRAAGLRNETNIASKLRPYSLESIRAPTLIISARDDGYGTFASAQYTASKIANARFVGYEHGGHMFVGHEDEINREILKLLIATAK